MAKYRPTPALGYPTGPPMPPAWMVPGAFPPGKKPPKGYGGKRPTRVVPHDPSMLGPNPVSAMTGGGITTGPDGRPKNLGFNPKDPESVRRVQKFLQGKGYRIDVDGKWGPMTKGAFENFTVKGTEQASSRNPEWYNAHIGRPSTIPDRSHPTTRYPPTRYGPTDPPARTTSAAADPPGYTFDPNSLNPNVGAPVFDLGQGASLYDVKKGASSLAGAEFDPQIHQNLVDQSHVQPDLTQHLADIGSWYGQVLKSLGTAKGRNSEMFKNTSAESGNAARDILSSLGGNANQAAGVVGEAGAANANELGQMGAAESAYQNDLTPIFNSEAAGAKTGEQALSSQRANELANHLIDLRGQRGQSVANHTLDLQDKNNAILGTRQQQLFDRLKYNNELAQSHFGNALSIAQTAAAAAMSGAQIKNINASTTATRTSTKANAGGFVPWKNLDPGKRDYLISNALGGVEDPTTHGLLKGVNDLKAWQMARQYLISRGYTSAHATGSGPLAGQIPDMQAHSQIEQAIRNALAGAKLRTTTGTPVV